MRKILTLTAAIALAAAFGLAQPAFAFPDNANVNDGDDATPNCADISTLSAVSDGDGGVTGEITVTMVLLANVSNCASNTKYRVHFDYDDGNGIASEVTRNTGLCSITSPFVPTGTTSDDTSKVRTTGGGNKSTGPGSDHSVVTTTIVYVVEYADLGLVAGDDVEIWADTQRKGIIDRAPDTDDADGCSKPTGAGEVLQITLDAPD